LTGHAQQGVTEKDHEREDDAETERSMNQSRVQRTGCSRRVSSNQSLR
jgi:hypothetical protein